MNKKCKICGNDFVIKQKENEYCSNKCFYVYIESEEFNNELKKALCVDEEELLKHQLRQAFHKMAMYSNQFQEVSTKLMDKVGYESYNNILNLLMNKNEEGDNI